MPACLSFTSASATRRGAVRRGVVRRTVGTARALPLGLIISAPLAMMPPSIDMVPGAFVTREPGRALS